nr:hypothetical protein [Cytophagales bacterium]
MNFYKRQPFPEDYMNNLKKITPFLAIGIISIFFGLYKWTFEGQGLGKVAVILLFVVAAVVLLIDFGFKKWLKTFKKIAAVELIILGVLIAANQYQYNRTKTLEIPTDFNHQFVTIIYGVGGQPHLGITDLTLAKIIKIPDNGILITATKYDIDLPQTKIKTADNEYYNTTESDVIFGQFGGEIQFADKIYRYRSWQIGNKAACCSHTGEEIQIYELDLKRELKNETIR